MAPTLCVGAIITGRSASASGTQSVTGCVPTRSVGTIKKWVGF
ncbi:hypothetical protein OF001_U30090 [Pseudomonas sp. OF001]|nr:hypothetical protein OF001_U30090 [Pseudomonas sp. OF001]